MVAAKLKALLLSEGVSFKRSFFKDSYLKKGFYANQYVYNKTSEGIEGTDIIPQGLCLEDGVFSSLLRREKSSISLELMGTEFQFLRKNTSIGKFNLPEKPLYFGKKLKDGLLLDNVIAVAGENVPGFIFFPTCDFIVNGRGCAFCNVVGTRKKYGKDFVSKFTLQQIIESIKVVFATDWKAIDTVFITTGSMIDMDSATLSIAEMIGEIRKSIPANVRIHLLTSPPKNLSLLQHYKDMGVSTIAFNIEVNSEDLFNEFCPGKRKYIGFDNFWKALFTARRVFGDYNVYCGFIWGLESIESTLEGYLKCFENGVSVSSNVFHSDPNTNLRNHPHPSTKTIVELSEKQSVLYLKYPQAKSLFNCSMRSTLDFEIYRGDFR